MYLCRIGFDTIRYFFGSFRSTQEKAPRDSYLGLESDIEGSFKALADDGYVVMEISNYNAFSGTVAGYKPGEYAALAKKYGLDIISSHARAKFDVKDVDGTLPQGGAGCQARSGRTGCSSGPYGSARPYETD